MTGNWTSWTRPCAPRRSRSSSITTPFSFSTSPAVIVTAPAHSRKTSSPVSNVSAESVGTWSMYTVSSNDV